MADFKVDIDGPSFLFSLSDGTVKGITGYRVMVVRCGGEGRVVQAIVGDGSDGGVISSSIDMLLGRSSSVS